MKRTSLIIRGLRLIEPELIVKKLGVSIKDLCIDVVDVIPIRPRQKNQQNLATGLLFSILNKSGQVAVARRIANSSRYFAFSIHRTHLSGIAATPR